MKKFFVIGNPINHSLSPLLHGHWFKKHGIKALYEKKLIKDVEDIKNVIKKIKQNEINGINVTVPFKNTVIPHLDRLSFEAEKTKSVNTIAFENKELVGYNTDAAGFELAIRYRKFDVSGKKILIIGSGGVVTSLVYSLKKLQSKEIFIMNRTLENAKKVQEIFNDIKIIDWGKSEEFDMIINATSVGLKEGDRINLDLNRFGKNKFFYDVIYRPQETLFLKEAKNLGNQIENGKMMFIYQAHQAFSIWNKILPVIDDKTIKLIEK